MKQLKATVFIALFPLLLNPAFAQNRTTEKLEKISKDLNGLLGKKDQETKDSEHSPGKQKNVTELKPGDVHPDAKHIDADVLEHFWGGAAVIKKGNAHALIDSSGNFIVPYGKYLFTVVTNMIDLYEEINNGIFIIRNPERPYSDPIGIMNSTGKTFMFTNYPNLRLGTAGITRDGNLIAVEEKTSEMTYLFDAGGLKYSIKPDTRNGFSFAVAKHITGTYNEGLWICHNAQSKKGFRNLKGEWIINPIFDEAEMFSDGMALVGNKDEFGILKYGFIDKTGKQVIPFIYSQKPASFKYGYAKVYPKDKSEFEYAFIDKTGKIILKHTRSDIARHGHFQTFYHGFSFNTLFGKGDQVLHPDGKVMSIKDLFKEWNISTQDRIDFLVTPYDGRIDEKIHCKSNKPGMDLIVDVKKRKGLFIESTTINTLKKSFDVKAGRLLYSIMTGRDQNSKPVLREGYINEDGIFIIVKGSGSQW